MLAALPLTSSSSAAEGVSPAASSGAPARGAATVTPEQFGAIGDGVADDAPAIQRALDMVARGPGGMVLLQPGVAYRCGSGLTLDASRVSLSGNALLDFSGWTGRYLHVVAGSVSGGRGPDNNYGHKGMISGAIRLQGAGPDTRSIGIDFDSPTTATSAQMLVENMAVYGCGVGVRFGDRAYNNLFLHCEIFACGVCIDWPAAQDNGERNTLIGCTLYNSQLAVRITLPSASLQLQNCSLDYTARLYEVVAGSVLAYSCHHESNRWEDRPIRCSGDGALIRLDGGWILNAAPDLETRYLVDVGKGAAVQMGGMIAHNLALKRSDATRPSALATGAGDMRMNDTRTLDFGALPDRLHATTTTLSDPDFKAPTWQDPIWRLHDTGPIAGRYGRNGADNLTLTKGMIAGERVLVAAKAGGATTPAAFVLIALPVRHGDAVLAGFRARRDPARHGGDGTLLVSPTWVRIDGQDAAGVPVVVRQQAVGTLSTTPPDDRFVPVVTLASRTNRTAPPWATHFCMIVDLAKAHQASFAFNGLWADLI